MEKHYSKTKTMWGNIVAIHSVFFFKIRNKILNQLNMKKKKIDKDHFRRKKIHKKKKRKSCMEPCNNL
jgi:hypothetical protein